MDTVKDRLVLAFGELRHKNAVRNQTDFGDKIKYGKAYVSRLFNGHEEVSYQIATEIQTVFKIDAQWLLTGQGEMFITNKSEKENNNSYPIVNGNAVLLPSNKIEPVPQSFYEETIRWQRGLVDDLINILKHPNAKNEAQEVVSKEENKKLKVGGK